VHGVVHSSLIVKLNLEVVQALHLQVHSSNLAMIEAAIMEARPTLVRDVQMEAYQCLHPFRVNGDVLDDGARLCKQRGI
jgi:hypothetical protein